jgi:AraC-like DNA-binding protein
MRQSHTRQPRQELRNFVRAYGQRDVDPSGLVTVSVVPPRLEQTMEFQFGEPLSYLHPSGILQKTHPIMIMGASTGAGTLSLPACAVSFAVFFQPNGFTRLFGVPMIETSGHAYEASIVLGMQLSGLQAALAECNSFAQRILIMDAFLFEKARQYVRSRGVQSRSMEGAAGAIFAEEGAVRVSEVASVHGFSLRQFERKFLAQTGMRPKLYARIARFQSALDAKVRLPSRPWLDIAHSLGYHDEMHLVHDFHMLAGSAPGKTVSMIGDTRPTAFVEF